jgi:leucyl aminopeptidase
MNEKTKRNIEVAKAENALNKGLYKQQGNNMVLDTSNIPAPIRRPKKLAKVYKGVTGSYSTD